MPKLSNGIESESYVVTVLNRQGYALTLSDDYHTQTALDIDGYDEQGRSYSIKTQHMALDTGNVVFEDEVLDAYDGWVDAWWRFGTADFYIMRVGCVAWVFRRNHLKGYVKRWGWSGARELSPATQAHQVVRGHRHLNARVKLLRLSQLLENVPHRTVNLVD